MLHIKCHVNIDQVVSVVLCVASVTEFPVPMVCKLASGQSVSDSVPSTDGVYTGFRPVS